LIGRGLEHTFIHCTTYRDSCSSSVIPRPRTENIACACGEKGETQGEEGRLKTPEWSGTVSIILGMDIIMQTRRIETERSRNGYAVDDDGYGCMILDFFVLARKARERYREEDKKNRMRQIRKDK
jgi:hypothetical protein